MRGARITYNPILWRQDILDKINGVASTPKNKQHSCIQFNISCVFVVLCCFALAALECEALACVDTREQIAEGMHAQRNSTPLRIWFLAERWSTTHLNRLARKQTVK